MNELLTTAVMGLGWIGALVYLLAYYCVSSGKLAADSLRYQGLCIISGLCMVVMCSATGAWPSVFSNVVFVGIGIYIILTVKRAYVRQLLETKMHRATFAQRPSNQPATASNPLRPDSAEPQLLVYHNQPLVDSQPLSK